MARLVAKQARRNTERGQEMRTFEGETVVTLKEASERFMVPVTWLRKQMGKPVLQGGKPLRVVKFPADKNYYLFLSEVEEISKPRVFSLEYIEKTQRDYERDPDSNNDPDW
jgi:hypothetical protein